MASNDPKQTDCFFSSIASSLSNFDSAMSKSVNGAGRYEVDGYVYNSDEEPKILMTGKWNHSTSYQPCDSDGEPLPGTEFKEGDLSKAGFEKSSLEEKQRVEKRNRETKRHQFTPRWFDKTDEIVPTSWDDLEIYSYNGKYIQHCALVEDSSDHADTIDIKSMEFNPLQYENLAAK